MIDKFLKATGLKNEKEFLKRYPTEDSFFTEYPEYMPYKRGGVVNHMQYGGYQSQTRRQGNIQITEDTPMDTFVPTNNNRNNGIFPVDPVSQMAPLMNPYATPGFNQNQLPINYQPYDSVSYEGLLSDNYKRKEFNPATGGWDDMGRATKVELQPQYHGDWNNIERMNFERFQPEQIGGYKTTRGKRSRKFGNRTINYDPYQYGGQYQQGGEYDLTPEEIDSLKKLGYDFENL